MNTRDNQMAHLRRNADLRKCHLTSGLALAPLAEYAKR